MQTINSKNFVNQMFMLFKTAQIHDPGNQAFAHPLKQFHAFLESLMEQEGTLTLESVEMSLYLNGSKIRTDISTFGTFKFITEEFAARNISGLRFLKVPELDELSRFVRIFARAEDPSLIGAEVLNDLLVQKDIQSVEFLERIEKRTINQADLARKVNLKRRALRNYVKTMDVVRASAQRMAQPRAADARKAKRLVYNLVDICLDEGFSFLGLSSIKNYDEYTYNHSVNVCVISIGFGKNLGLSKRQLGELGIAGLYHDYGKLSIPKEILNKPGRFDPEEWEVMKTHPLRSIKELLKMESFQESDIKKMIAAFEHHRNYDCSGYPQTGIKKDLNFYSKVVAIADSYDAMTTNRAYQRAMVPTKALKIIMDAAGTKFDPVLVKAFVNTVGIYPVGTLVQLDSGELGVVSAVHKDPDKMQYPIVRLVLDPAGNKISEALEVDLSADPSQGRPAREIRTVLHPEDYGINVAHYLFSDLGQALNEVRN